MNRAIRILAAALVLLAVALAAYAWLLSQPGRRDEARARGANAPAVPSHPVVVLARPVAAGQALTADMLKVEPLPVRLQGTFGDRAAVVGRQAALDLAAGTPLLESQLASGLALRVPPGERAVAVRVDDVIGIGHRVRPGDRVDVFVVLKREDHELADTEARLLLSRLQVLAYGTGSIDAPADAAPAAQRDGSAPAAGSSAGAAGRRDQPRNAVLSVPVDQVAALVLAEQSGRISLALRHPSDAGTPSADPLVGTRPALPIAAASTPNDRALAGLTLSSMGGIAARPEAARARSAAPRADRPRPAAPAVPAVPATPPVEVLRGGHQSFVAL